MAQQQTIPGMAPETPSNPVERCDWCKAWFRPYPRRKAAQRFCSPQCSNSWHNHNRRFLNAPYQSHSQTSQEAAEKVVPNAGTQRRRVLEALRERGPMTDEELQQLLRMNPSTQRPRRVELIRAGFVQDSGETRRTTSGRKATVWEAAGD